MAGAVDALSHLEFPCPKIEKRWPLVALIERVWYVVQPDWSGGTFYWDLPPVWQEWLFADGKWDMEPTDTGGYVLRYVT